MTRLADLRGAVVSLVALGLVAAMPLVACAQDPKRTSPVNPRATTDAPTFAQVRRAALAAFLGGGKFDDVSELSLADYQVKEQAIMAVCRPPEMTRQRAVRIFSAAGFHEVQSAATWPGYTVHLVRELTDPPKKLDIVMFFFGIQKAGVDCKYTVGAFTRRELKSPRQVLGGEDRDAVLDNVRTLRTSFLTEMRQ
jgi:hypothetical protein